VLKSGLARAAPGLVLGLGAAAGAAPLLRSILNGVEAHDAATFAGTGALLLVVATVATLAPALRAMRLDPVRILSEE
jgi:ABC-type lipoprotein release transport system permease subunit